MSADDIAPELLDMIELDEEFRSRLYIDTEGLQTIGLGFCLDRMPMPRAVALYWCRYILSSLQNRISTAKDVGEIFQQLDQPRQWAILNMCYQMGVSGVCQFKKMWAALGAGDYDRAEKEALDSVWAVQTKQRANRVAGVIRSGSLEGYGLES